MDDRHKEKTARKLERMAVHIENTPEFLDMNKLRGVSGRKVAQKVGKVLISNSQYFEFWTF